MTLETEPTFVNLLFESKVNEAVCPLTKLPSVTLAEWLVCSLPSYGIFKESLALNVTLLFEILQSVVLEEASSLNI